MAKLQGVCTSLIVAGQTKPCSSVKGVSYAVFKNGGVMISTMADKVLMSYVAEHDSQPDPATYIMDIDQIAMKDNRDSPSQAVNVSGECKVTMSQNPPTWHAFDCKAKDANGLTYAFSMQFDNQVISLKQLP